MHGSGCNLVHASRASIMIDSPWWLPRLAEYGNFITHSRFSKHSETMT
jgi:hypothetical protein